MFNVMEAAQAPLARHQNECNNCCPVWEDHTTLEVDSDPYKRILEETMHVIRSGNCVSHASMSLHYMRRHFWDNQW